MSECTACVVDCNVVLGVVVMCTLYYMYCTVHTLCIYVYGHSFTLHNMSCVHTYVDVQSGKEEYSEYCC